MVNMRLPSGIVYTNNYLDIARSENINILTNNKQIAKIVYFIN